MYNQPAKEFRAEAVFNTWAKTGYLFDLGNLGGCFICEYLMYLKPEIFVLEFSLEEMKQIEDGSKKIIFGGYQEFEFKSIIKTNEVSLILANLESKGLFNKSDKLQKIHEVVFNSLSKIEEINDDESEFDFSNSGKFNLKNNITYLGLKNIRNISDYQDFNLGAITFVTGQNNSGKSSLLKSILLLSDLKYDNQKDKFIIDQNSDLVKRLNLDFKTIVNDGGKSNIIQISVNLNFKIEKFKNEDLKAEFTFSVFDTYLELNCFLVDFIIKNDQIDFILKLEDKDSCKCLSIRQSIFTNTIETDLLEYKFDDIPGIGFNSLFNIDNQHLPLIHLLNFKVKEIISEIDKNYELNNLFNSISHLIRNLNLELHYIPSMKSELKRSFNPENSKIGKSIEVLEQNLDDNPKITILKHWLDEFGIGNDLQIDKLNNGTYELKFGKKNIADLGFGFMQLFPVLVDSIFTFGFFGNIVIIEEPESNLHPNLQSKLADFFFEINKDFKTQFIIETHSEYLIRNTQYIGLCNNLFKLDSDNPFKIIYCDKNEGLYEIKYTEEGRFDRNFGDGFYNEAGKLNLLTAKESRK